MVRFDAMPRELTDRSNWLLWRADQGKKVPYIVSKPSRRASSTNRRTWDTFDAAKAAYSPTRDSGVPQTTGSRNKCLFAFAMHRDVR